MNKHSLFLAGGMLTLGFACGVIFERIHNSKITADVGTLHVEDTKDDGTQLYLEFDSDASYASIKSHKKVIFRINHPVAK